MNYLTRYYFQLNKIFNFLIKKLKRLKENFLSFLLLLFFGFFIGNLFGTFINLIRQFNIPDSVLIFLIILINEFINFIVYRQKQNRLNSTLIIKLYNFLNIFKIGILLGFFIDSFKVGS
nr:hypothetical protein Ycf20 [Ostreobium sp. TRHA14-720]